MKKNLIVIALAIMTLSGRYSLAQTRPASGELPLVAREVRHELVMLPYYSVFDNLKFGVDRGAVTLEGQVTRPTLKTDAEAVVKKIEGVKSVVNNIEVLPLSPTDDRFRIAIYYALFAQNSPLMRYGLGSVPSIHIIVKNGRVTLEGVVDDEGDRAIATAYASKVSGTLSVTNNLVVQKPA